MEKDTTKIVPILSVKIEPNDNLDIGIKFRLQC